MVSTKETAFTVNLTREDAANYDESIPNREEDNFFFILYEKVEERENLTSLYNSILWVSGKKEDAIKRAAIMQRNGHRVHAITVATCWIDEKEWRLSEDEIREKGPR